MNWLSKFLPTLLKFSKEDAEIYVIDNGSTDNSIELINKDFHEVKTIELKENLGFAGGYNEGLKQLDHQYFILVNSDIEVTESWITPLIKMLDQNPDASSVQPKILNYNSKEEFEYAGAAGGFIDMFAYPICRGRIFTTIEKDNGQYDDNCEIFWSSGACMAVRADVFSTYNGFDKDFFAHMEEIDLCWRLKNNGRKILFCHESIVYHVGGGTLIYNSPRKTFLNYRNNLCMIHKNYYGSLPLFLLIIIRIYLDQLSGLRFLIKGDITNVIAIYKAQFSYLFKIPELKAKRVANKQAVFINLTGVLNRSVIWEYFLEQKRIFAKIF